MVRFILGLGTALWLVAVLPGTGNAQYSPYYPRLGYRPPPSYGPPPCTAVTPGPFAGAARGAAVPPSPGWRPANGNVERVRCSDLLGASDEDRASAPMFYYGYLAAKAGIHIIDVSRIEGNIAKVVHQCAAAPNLTVPQAFREALRPPAHG
jgi:HdeA/HdeB family